MQLISSFFSYIKKQEHKPLSFLLAFSGALLIYIVFLQRNFFSKRYLLFTLLAFIALFLISLVVNAFVKERFINKISKADFRLCLWSAFLFSLVLLINFNPTPLYLLEKDRTLSIQPAGKQTGEQSPIGLQYVRNKLDYIPYSVLQILGNWREEGDHLLLETRDGFSIDWSGDTVELLEISFLPSDVDQVVNVMVNDVVYEINLHKDSTQEYVVFRLESEPTILSQMPFFISAGIVSTYLLFLLYGAIYFYRISRKQSSENHKIDFWLGLPLLITSAITLLTFWPGMMTNDSINQWREAVNGNFTDLNPILHTLLISALVKIVYSPAVVVIFQIVFFYLVLVYGLSRLRKRGVPVPVLIALSLIFALWLYNFLLVNILWKDVLYSLSLLLFFILLVEAALSNGEFFKDKKNYFLLAISAFLVSAFRHNGSPVAFVTLLILPFVYKQYRKALLYTFASVILIWTLVKWPVKSGISTEENDVNALNLTLLHHISAHLDAGSDFTPEQLDYLDDLLPIAEWQYDCCYMGNIYTNPDFNQDLLMQSTSLNRQMVFNLILQDPVVDIKDQLCASEMDWRFLNNRCMYKSLHPFDINEKGILGWIPENDFGLTEKSLLPEFVSFYYTILKKIGVFSGMPIAWLRPAFYMYAALLILIAVSVKFNNKRLLTAGLPVILQTGILILVNFAPAYRYQYGMCLIGLFSLGLLFLPGKEEK